jgi:hypothetical protein
MKPTSRTTVPTATTVVFRGSGSGINTPAQTIIVIRPADRSRLLEYQASI